MTTQHLAGRIKVRITQDPTGAITVRPVSKHVEAMVGATNRYDGHGYVYLQSGDAIASFLGDFPRAAYSRGGERRVNTNAVIFIDSWTFRQLCGGQND